MLLRTRSAALLTAVTVLAAAVPDVLTAQDAAAPQRNWVTVVRLKPDMVTEWVDLQRNEVLPALKKAGVPWRAVMATRAGNGYEYTLVQPFNKWADLDGPGPLVRALGATDAARLNAKLRKCIESSTSYIGVSRPDLTIQWGDARILRAQEVRVNAGQMPAYLARYKSEVMPQMEKAKAAGLIAGGMLTTNTTGTQFNQVVSFTAYKDFAGLDAGNPVLPVMGRECYEKMVASGAKLATTQRVRIMVFRPDLSMRN